MFLLNSLCKKVKEVLFGNLGGHANSLKRIRTLRIEELEPREMLSATSIDWDWDEWWGNFSSTTTQVDPLPAGYHVDSNSEDFGQISLGGNDSPIDATTAFTPDVISNLAAYGTTTRQANAPPPQNGGNSTTGNSPTVNNTETITVGIISQDLGGGDWTYTEATTYSNSLTSGDDLYWSGYSYYVSSSFIGGIYNSTFVLTTDYGGTAGFTAESETNDSSVSWTTMLDYSITDVTTITHFHNTLTSQRTSTDTRTTFGNSSYSESGTFSYSASDGSVSETFGFSATSTIDMHSNIAMSGTDSGWTVDSGTGHDSFYDYYNYSDNYLAAFSEADFSYSAEDNNRSNSLVVTNVDYIWDNGGWEILGHATVTDSSGYDWGMTLSAPHDTGSIYVDEDSSHDESSTSHWDYDDLTAAWVASSVSGTGEGTHSYTYLGDATTPYARSFYESSITGTEEVSIDHQLNESWGVSFRIVHGQVVREMDGGYTETLDVDTSFSGGGEYSTNQTTTSLRTVDSYIGTAIDHHELEASLSESGEYDYFATITGDWSHTANNQGELVWQESADAEIIITSSGSHHRASHQLTTSSFDGSYRYSNSCSYTNSSYHTDSATEVTSDISEEYDSVVIENWHSDGEGFALVSLVSIASGNGGNDVRNTSESNWQKTSLRGGPSGYGCGCGYSESSTEISHTFSDSFREDDYDYTSNWSWNINDGTTATVNDHITGGACGTFTDSWHCEWTYSNGCVGSTGYDHTTPHPGCDYDETISQTESGDDIDETIEALTTKRLQGLANLGTGFETTASTLNSFTLPGSTFELLKGRDASDKKLPLWERGLSGASIMPLVIFAKVEKALDKVDDILQAKPLQMHHFATIYGNNAERLQNIVAKYGLNLKGAWNKEVLPHLGRHTQEYHNTVIRLTKQAADEAGNDVNKFLELYEEYVKKWVRENPGVMYK